MVPSDSKDRIDCGFQYNTDILETETIIQMADTFTQILRSGCSKPSTCLEQLELVSNKQKVQQLCGLQTALEPKYFDCQPGHVMFESAVEQYGSKPALWHEEESMSYTELNKKANQVARSLLNCGVQCGQTVGLMLERDFSLVVGTLGIWKAGGAYVPMDPSYPSDRLVTYLEDSGAQVVLTHSSLVNKLKTLASELEAEPTFVCVDHCGRFSDQNLNILIDMNDLGYIIFTSGSTGRPKGVKVPHRCIMDFVQYWIDACSVDSTTVAVFTSTISFDGHVLIMYPPLMMGGQLVIPRAEEHLDPQGLADLMLRRSINAFLFAVPAVSSEWFKNPTMAKNTQVRVFAVGGEYVQPSLMRRAFEIFPLLGESGGLNAILVGLNLINVFNLHLDIGFSGNMKKSSSYLIYAVWPNRKHCHLHNVSSLSRN